MLDERQDATCRMERVDLRVAIPFSVIETKLSVCIREKYGFKIITELGSLM